MTHVVTASTLHLRSAPIKANGNIIASLPQDSEVSVLDRSSPLWWKVEATLRAHTLTGYVAAKHLVERAAVPEPVTAASVTAVHLPAAPRSQRALVTGRALPLAETLPKRDPNAPPAQRITDTYRIVEALDVHKSLRYQPVPGGDTYCNIYAYDVCFLAGVYVPRVWWTEKAIAELKQGKPQPIKYDTTVREMGANKLHDWFAEWGDDFGWRETFDLTELQSKVNDGGIGIVCAKRVDQSKSGHITCVIPELAPHAAQRSGMAVVGPLQSQAGRTNRKIFSDPWWVTRRGMYSSVLFFWHP